MGRRIKRINIRKSGYKNMNDAKMDEQEYSGQLLDLCKEALTLTTKEKRAEFFEHWCVGQRGLVQVYCHDLGIATVAFIFIAMMDVNHSFIFETDKLLRWNMEGCFIEIMKADLHDIKVIHRKVLITPDLSTVEVKL